MSAAAAVAAVAAGVAAGDLLEKAAAPDWKDARLAVARAYDALVEQARAQPPGPNGVWRFVRLPGGLECWLIVKPQPALPGPPPVE